MLKDQRGLLVLGVYKGSPAESSGLTQGDVIIKVQNSSGKTVETPDLEKFKAVTEAIPAQKPVNLTVLRAGKEVPFSIMRATGPFGPVIQPPVRTEPRTITTPPLPPPAMRDPRPPRRLGRLVDLAGRIRVKPSPGRLSRAACYV